MSDVDYSRIDFINDAERGYFEEARLGVNVSNFLQSDVGRYLHGRAKIALEEVKQQMLDLSSAMPDFQSQFDKLQQEAWCAEHFMKWCAEAIVNGEGSEQQLEEYRNG